MLGTSFLARRMAAKAAQPVLHNKEDIEGLENYWSKAMGWYSIYNSKLSLKTYKTIRPFLKLENARKIVEIGGGTGSGAEILIPHLDSTAKYYLTDHIECFLKVARSKNLANTEVINADPVNLPFPGESFDRFIALATIEELDKTRNVLREAYRVLTPGGIIAASVSGKRESDNYRMITDRIKQKFGLHSYLKFRSDLKSIKITKKIFSEAGFDRIFSFSENIHFESTDINEIKAFIMQEPSFAEQDQKTQNEIDRYLEKELSHLIKVEGTPLSTDSLVLIGIKG